MELRVRVPADQRLLPQTAAARLDAARVARSQAAFLLRFLSEGKHLARARLLKPPPTVVGALTRIKATHSSDKTRKPRPSTSVFSNLNCCRFLQTPPPPGFIRLKLFR